MPKPRTGLTEHDRDVWHNYANQVRPLRGRVDVPKPVSLPPIPDAKPASSPRKAKPPAPASELGVGAAPAGLDRATWTRFRTGKLAVARTLDLHGSTAAAAFDALMHFLPVAHGDGVRCVEIITGRGSGAAGGVLRRELPRWLNLPQLRHLVLAAAHPHAANPGSVRLLLRRAK